MNTEEKVMPTNVLVTGSAGQLGSEIQAIYFKGKTEKGSIEEELTQAYNFFFTDKHSLDITEQYTVYDFCKKNAIEVIINCAAYTAVDKAESEPEQAYLINEQAVAILAKIAKELAISLIHLSTDYVYDGTKNTPYKEDDLVNPLNSYGKSKLAGELILQTINPNNSIIIRTSWLYSSFGNNFVLTMLKLGKERAELSVVSDQVGSPTSARDLSFAILKAIPSIKNEQVKVYHYSNEGQCSWSEFAEAIFEFKDFSCKVNAILSQEYPTAAVRPLYTVLDKTKFQEDFHQDIKHWRDSLRLHINSR